VRKENVTRDSKEMNSIKLKKGFEAMEKLREDELSKDP